MPPKNEAIAPAMVLEILSFTGARAVMAESDGRITGMTRAFAETLGDHSSHSNLSDVFDDLPLPLPASHGDFRCVLKNSGREITGMTVPTGSGTGAAVLVIGQATETAPLYEQVQTVNASNDLVFQFNSSREVYYVSDNVERITGFAADEFISGRLHPLDLVYPEDRPSLERDFRDIFTTHRSIENSEHRIIRKNGDVAYLLKSWYPLFDSDGKFTGIIGLNKDITKEKLLRERLELFRSAFEHSTDAIVITGTDGKIIDVNDAFTRIYGYTRDEAVGNTTSIVKSKHSTPDFYYQMWSSLDKEDRWGGEILNRRKDGVEIPVWLSITPIYMDNKKIGYMGIESDISERKNLEQQIIQTEKLATIGQLAAGIAHEIGTPLNIISGNAEFVLLDLKESDPGYSELETILAQTKRISTLMRQLLDLARPKVLSLQPTDVNGVLADVINFIRIQFNKGNISIRTDFEDGIAKVYGDPALLYQVFLNIVVNSYQAMEKGGSLNIQTSTETTEESRKHIVIRIEDTGEGIHPDNLARIFTPFFTTKAPGKGTGLGLAVTKRIVQEHNGTIDIASNLGNGTTVTIRFNAFEQAKR